MQVEKENRLSVLGAMFIAFFVECGHCGMGKLNDSCLLEMLLEGWRGSGPSRIIIEIIVSKIM